MHLRLWGSEDDYFTVSPLTDKETESNREKGTLMNLSQGRRLGDNRDALFFREGGEAGFDGSEPFCGAVLPRQLTHHFQQSLVLLFELLILIFNVIQVLQKKDSDAVSTFWTHLRHMNIKDRASIPLRAKSGWSVSLRIKVNITCCQVPPL